MAYSIETPSGTSSSPTMIQRQIFRRTSLAAVSKRLGSGGGTVPIVVSAKMGLSLLAAAGDAGSYACQSGADGKGGGANASATTAGCTTASTGNSIATGGGVGNGGAAGTFGCGTSGGPSRSFFNRSCVRSAVRSMRLKRSDKSS